MIHALNKYVGGHGNSVGGIIIDSGKLDWACHPASTTHRQPNQAELKSADISQAALEVAKG